MRVVVVVQRADWTSDHCHCLLADRTLRRSVLGVGAVARRLSAPGLSELEMVSHVLAFFLYGGAAHKSDTPGRETRGFDVQGTLSVFPTNSQGAAGHGREGSQL